MFTFQDFLNFCNFSENLRLISDSVTVTTWLEDRPWADDGSLLGCTMVWKCTHKQQKLPNYRWKVLFSWSKLCGSHWAPWSSPCLLPRMFHTGFQ
jgi:hypothetical protein